MIIISRDLALSPNVSNPLGTPIFGIENLLTIGNVSANLSDPNNPESNLANPATFLYWQGAVGSPAEDHVLTLNINPDNPIDYIAIAGHNLGTLGAVIKIEAWDADLSPIDWVEIASRQLPDDRPAIFRFLPRAYEIMRVTIALSDFGVPRISNLHIGKLLVAERGTSGSVTPMNFARQTKITTGRSESGNFLGRIQTQEMLAGTFSFEKLRPDWYREKFDAFVVSAQINPFFFAWKPTDFPRDTSFCWLMSDPQPLIDFDTKTMSVELQMGGLVL